ncbi:hypothetical protein GOODEAATRI_012289, partial [Goodea atripinnis]
VGWQIHPYGFKKSIMVPSIEEAHPVCLCRAAVMADVDAIMCTTLRLSRLKNERRKESGRGCECFTSLYPHLSFSSAPPFAPHHSVLNYLPSLSVFSVFLCASLLLALSVERRNVCAADPQSVRCGASADRFGV